MELYHPGCSLFKIAGQSVWREIILLCFHFFPGGVFWVFSRFNYSPGLNFWFGFFWDWLPFISRGLAGQLTQFKTLAPRAQTSNYQIVCFPLCVLCCVRIQKRKSKPDPKNFVFLCLLFSSRCKRIQAPADSRNGTTNCVGDQETGEQGLLILLEETQ